MNKIHMTTTGLLEINAANRALNALIQAVDNIEAGLIDSSVSNTALNELLHPELIQFMQQIRQIKLSMLDIERYLENIHDLTL